MRLDIRYRLNFVYPGPVYESHNEIRVRPIDDPTQRVISYRLSTSPGTRVLSFEDYWGTTVEHVGIREPHASYEIVAEAAVDTTAPSGEGPDAPRQALDNADFVRDFGEFLEPTEHTATPSVVREMALDAGSDAGTVAELVAAINVAAHGALRYESNSTEIGISLADLVEGGAGVCQDYAHLACGMLRSVGVPARYVSGYLFASDETNIGDDADTVSVQTHAWVEAAVPGGGWIAADPTNDQTVGERHVIIGRGRDYDDVAPVRGVYVGDAVPTVDAEVVMAKMAPVGRYLTSAARSTVGTEQLRQMRDQQQQQQQ